MLVYLIGHDILTNVQWSKYLTNGGVTPLLGSSEQE